MWAWQPATLGEVVSNPTPLTYFDRDDYVTLLDNFLSPKITQRFIMHKSTTGPAAVEKLKSTVPLQLPIKITKALFCHSVVYTALYYFYLILIINIKLSLNFSNCLF